MNEITTSKTSLNKYGKIMFVIVWTDICVVSINPLCLFVQAMAIIISKKLSNS